MNNKKKWLTLFIICMGAGIIYVLPQLRYTFYEPLKEALGITDTQMGLLSGVFGVVNLIAFIPGGYIADKYSTRKLISFSLVATGLLGFYYATFPSFEMCMVIFFLWGIVSVMTYWSAMLKAVAMLSEGNDSSKEYGLLEGGRGLIATVVSFVCLFVFAKLGEGTLGVSGVINIYSVLLVLIGILSYFMLQDSSSSQSSSESVTVKDMLKIAKNLDAWLIALIILGTICMLYGATYLTPYVEVVFGASASIAVALGIIRSYLMQLIGGPSGGFIASKVGSSTKTLFVGFIISIAGCLVFLVTPMDKSLIWIVLINTVATGFVFAAMKGIYFSTVTEAKFPIRINGSVVGFVSIIGMSPEAFLHPMVGSWLDTYGNDGYRMLFVFMAIMGVVGLVSSIILLKRLKNKTREESLIVE